MYQYGITSRTAPRRLYYTLARVTFTHLGLQARPGTRTGIEMKVEVDRIFLDLMTHDSDLPLRHLTTISQYHPLLFYPSDFPAALYDQDQHQHDASSTYQLPQVARGELTSPQTASW
jgi:hypothetical protein